MQAQDIVDMITQSERFANSTLFSDELYRDEPILRTGASAYPGVQRSQSSKREQTRRRSTIPAAYRKLRALEREQGSWGYGYGYTSGGSRLFFEQAKLMEDFEDAYEVVPHVHMYYPSYSEMTDAELRSYFSWRTQLRAGKVGYAPTAFLYVHVYELLCGVGVRPGLEGYWELRRFAKLYEGVSQAFDDQVREWSLHYIVYHGLDASLLEEYPLGNLYQSVLCLRGAQEALLSTEEPGTWPASPVEGLPQKTELLDAMGSLSRYRAERSRFIKANRADVAEVVAGVFAQLVEHCHKRRKTDYVDGLFGAPVMYACTMFPGALFWDEHPPEDAEYDLGNGERYVCSGGYWYHEYPSRRLVTNKELGALLHAIDCRMRVAMGDKHPLKEKSLPKFQGRFVDRQIAALLERKAQEERTKLRIDRSSLGGIRSAAARTREALLTDEEREEDVATPDVTLSVAVEDAAPDQGGAAGGLPLDAGQLALLHALLEGGDVASAVQGGFVSIAVDAINEAFLDIVGDTVVEFDGDTPVLVEDYEQDVRDALV